MTSSEVQAYDVTIAAGTTAAAPAVADIPTGVRVVNQLFITFPDGCNGLVGIRLTMGGVAVIPRNDGGWIRGNDRVVPYQLAGFPDGGDWQLTAYNTDLYNHTISVEFLLSQVAAPGDVTTLTPSVAQVSAAALAPVPDAAALVTGTADQL